MYILSLDQGTTSSRAILFDKKAQIVATGQMAFKQHYPQNGWVEHDPEDIWQTTMLSMFDCVNKAGIEPKEITSIGITNQRETTIVWDRKTGKAIHPAIVWQDRRTADYCRQLIEEGHAEMIQNKTGLLLDAYFSATKIKYILDTVEGAREQANKGDLAFGTVDAWLVWKLTEGRKHLTDPSNASRTLLYNIHTLSWDKDLLNLFDIPDSMLPEVVDSSGNLTNIDVDWFAKEIPIQSIIGDQQAALFGQACLQKGSIKNTYGTGCFIMLNTGEKPVKSAHKMLSTIAWKIADKTHYALEGSVFVAGAITQWLIDELQLFESIEALIEATKNVDDSGDVFFVPALTGLGAPHWDPNARGSIHGITRASNKGQIALAALQGIAFQVNDVIQAMQKDLQTDIKHMKVDGGVSANSRLMQFQSDISQLTIVQTAQKESTALGAALLAGLAAKYWTLDQLSGLNPAVVSFKDDMENDHRVALLSKWKKALQRSQDWTEK